MGSLPIFGTVSAGVGISTNASSALYLDVTPSATANTKGNYIQATSATTGDVGFVVMQLANIFAVAQKQYAADFAIGALGSEVVLASNLMSANCAQTQQTYTYAFPCNIPSGTRIAFRAQSSTSTTLGLRVTMQTFATDLLQAEGFAGVDAIGFNAATTKGVTVNSTTTQKGPYTQVTAATTRDYAGLSMAVDTVVGQHLLDIAIGAGGSEVVVIPNVVAIAGNPVALPLIPIQVPLGTRIAARGEVNVANSANVTVYGYYQ